QERNSVSKKKRKSILLRLFAVEKSALPIRLWSSSYRESCSVVQTGVQWHDLSSLKPLPPAYKHFSCCSFQVSGTTNVCHHAWIIFVFFVEIGFHHIGQTGLELLTSSDLPASASQSAGITDVSHPTWPTTLLL
uniref:Uncharacterized protein n=1 Tax=Callithrix jacchus TaxID=9483 RepID=A0A8I3VXH0_CALJA